MTGAGALFRRELRLAWGRGEYWLPVTFFLLVATLFPFAVGPDSALLARTGGGVLWMAALLAALLPIERLIRPDRDAGVLDQLAIRGLSDEMVAAVKIAAHTLGFALPLLVATVPAAALLGLDGVTLRKLLIGLAIGAPALASLSVTVAALTAGLRGGTGALAGLLLFPLLVPVLIFGAGMLNPAGAGAVKLLAASSLLLTAIGPFAAGAALRSLRE